MTSSTTAWAESRSPDSFPWVDVPVADHRLRLFGLHEDDHIFATVRTTGRFYEEALLRFLGGFVEPDDLVVDVGANVGNHTAYVAGVLGCTVRAFEAVPVLADVLSLTVRANFLDGRVRIEPCAVGRRAGRLDVASWNPSNSGATRLADSGAGSIPMVALDDLEWPDPPRAIKIDVEGMELAVLDGAADLIRRHRPLLLTEAVDAEADADVRGWMRRHGYAVLGVFNATPTLVCAPIDGTAGRTPDEAIYRTIEHLGARIDEVHAHLDRLGRYVGRMQGAVEKRLQHVPDAAPPPVAGAAPVAAALQAVLDENARLRATLDALGRPVGSALPGTAEQEEDTHD